MKMNLNKSNLKDSNHRIKRDMYMIKMNRMMNMRMKYSMTNKIIYNHLLLKKKVYLKLNKQIRN
jgi:hypothetical protein